MHGDEQKLIEFFIIIIIISGFITNQIFYCIFKMVERREKCDGVQAVLFYIQKAAN